VEEDIEACKIKYMKSKTVHSIMANVVTNQTQEQKLSLEELYKVIGWPLYEKFGHAYEAFKKAAAGDDVFEGLQVPAHLVDLLLKTLKHRMGSQPVKIQADIQVTCFTYEGIDAIKPALRAALEIGTEDQPIKVQLVSSPEYILFTSSTDSDSGINLLKKAIEAVQTEIKKYGGDCVVKNEPRVLGEPSKLDLIREDAT